MPALRSFVPHDNPKDESKSFWKETATVLMSDGIAEYMKENNERITFVFNHLPGVKHIVFPPKDETAEKPKW